MDPEAIWKELWAAHEAGDWKTVSERADDLEKWLKSGGAAPVLLKNFSPTAWIQKTLTMGMIAKVRRRARKSLEQAPSE